MNEKECGGRGCGLTYEVESIENEVDDELFGSVKAYRRCDGNDTRS